MLNFGNYVNTNRPNVVFYTNENGLDRDPVWYKTMWLQCGNKMMSDRPVQIDRQEALDIISTYPGENGPGRESVWFKTMWLQCGNKMMSGQPVRIERQEAMDIMDTYPGEWVEGDYIVDMDCFQGHEDMALVDYASEVMG